MTHRRVVLFPFANYPEITYFDCAYSMNTYVIYVIILQVRVRKGIFKMQHDGEKFNRKMK